jgi:hypothetical protein
MVAERHVRRLGFSSMHLAKAAMVGIIIKSKFVASEIFAKLNSKLKEKLKKLKFKP